MPASKREFKRGAQPEPGDEQVGEYTREQLMRMDRRFVEAVERAIKLGRERRPAETKARAA